MRFSPLNAKTDFISFFFRSILLVFSPSLQYQLTQLCSGVAEKEEDEVVSIILIRVRGVTAPRELRLRPAASCADCKVDIAQPVMERTRHSIPRRR